MANEIYADAQSAVIGSLLIDPEAVAGAVMRMVGPEDFTEEYRTVFEAILGVYADGVRIDPVVVLARLGDGYKGFLRQCMDATPTTANAEAHCQVVREQAALERLRDIGLQLAGAVDAGEARKVLEDAQRLMAERQGLRGRPLWSLMSDFYGWITDPTPPAYLPWGLRQLDEGLTAEAGDFILLGADSSVGKTALAVQLAWAQAAKGKRVGFFSLETNALKLTRRLVAQRARIPMSALKMKTLSDEQLRDLAAFGSATNKVPLFMYDAAGCSVAELRAAAAADRLDVLYVDYVQLLSAPGRERWEIVTAISMGLHTMAQQLGVAVVGLSQITAANNDRKSKPDKDDLRESKQLKQDADVIIMLGLDDPEDPDSLRWLHITKNKDGPLNSVCLRFDAEHMDFQSTDSRAWRPPSARKKTKTTFKDAPDEAVPFIQEGLPL